MCFFQKLGEDVLKNVGERTMSNIVKQGGYSYSLNLVFREVLRKVWVF